MDLTNREPQAVTARSLPEGIDHAALEHDGPKAFGDRMGTPAANEKVLWKGRPALGLFARTAFHTRTLGLYFAGLTVIALALGNRDGAIIAAVMGVALIALLYLLAWASTRTTLYILTDSRLIMRIGMAIETRINLPLKQITAAHFRPRGDDHGDIALELAGERLLGAVLLWPHMRPWHFNRPQPMLRCVPEAAKLAQLIAETRAQYGTIEQNLIEIKDAAPANAQQGLQPAASQGRMIPALHRNDQGLEGAPA
jgi:Bacterial PH domain